MQKVYALLVVPHYAPANISQVAYTTVDKAQNFIEHRSDSPVKQSDFYYIGRLNSYYIKELFVY